MIRMSGSLFLLLGFICLAGITQGTELELSPTDRILILVPHPDDEVLCCGGIIQQAVQQHLPIKILFFTYGDNNAWSFTVYRHFPVFRPKTMQAMGRLRHDEALAAALVLGVPSDQLIFLGYPDYGTLTIWNNHWARSPAYESRMTRVRAVPYSTAYRPGAEYRGEEILRDLESILKDVHPTKIFIPHPADLRPDHRALTLFTSAALWDLPKDRTPEVYSYLVHFPAWPPRRGLHMDKSLDPPIVLRDKIRWLTLPLTPLQVNKKLEALKKHRTQWAYSSRSLTSYVRRNELFGDSSDVTLRPQGGSERSLGRDPPSAR